ncbi:MAG: DNA starvation/stationary phase protection protein [Flavobacteriales bacterium]|jgi:starvation-inducible DNA-binding protein|nr:DNA starvation/stationary phase protection protein [Flavobacteriales bacterium]
MKTTKTTKKLNKLLASYQIFYQNLRGFHWNIKGKSFFELHVKFEEMYLDAQDKIDLIAERILTLGGRPIHHFEDYLEKAEVTAVKNISKDEKIVHEVIFSLETLLAQEKDLLDLSDESEDEGTNSMMSDFIGEQEKALWMFNAWLA